MMVGEIRDPETAEIAIRAAQTGHLVLSTLHTNSAAETLTRLLNMGIPSFQIASSINLIIAQRLVRKLCQHCKAVRDDITLQNLQDPGLSATTEHSVSLYKASSCALCTNGYHGRIGLFEVLPMSGTIARLIMSGASAMTLLKQAQTEGMLTIWQSGLDKIKQGITTIEEINRATMDYE